MASPEAALHDPKDPLQLQSRRPKPELSPLPSVLLPGNEQIVSAQIEPICAGREHLEPCSDVLVPLQGTQELLWCLPKTAHAPRLS